jgi:hypothetical protein
MGSPLRSCMSGPGRAGEAYATVTKPRQKSNWNLLIVLHSLYRNILCPVIQVLSEASLETALSEILMSLVSKFPEKSIPWDVYSWSTLKIDFAVILRLSNQKFWWYIFHLKWPSCLSDSHLICLLRRVCLRNDFFKFMTVSAHQPLNSPNITERPAAVLRASTPTDTSCPASKIRTKPQPEC